MASQQCPRCRRDQPETSTSGKCLFCGASVPAASESLISLVPPPPPPDEPLAVPPPPAPDAADELEAGKRPCPGCGEILYESEGRCWRCGHEFEAPPAPEPEPATAPAPPPLETAAPPAPGLPVPPPATDASRQAQVYGIWALVVGLLGLFGCLGLISPLAIYLGVRANRSGNNNLGTVGMVLGFIGTIMLVIAVAVVIAGLFSTGGSSATTPNSPDVLLPCRLLRTHC